MPWTGLMEAGRARYLAQVPPPPVGGKEEGPSFGGGSCAEALRALSEAAYYYYHDYRSAHSSLVHLLEGLYSRSELEIVPMPYLMSRLYYQSAVGGIDYRGSIAVNVKTGRKLDMVVLMKILDDLWERYKVIRGTLKDLDVLCEGYEGPCSEQVDLFVRSMEHLYSLGINPKRIGKDTRMNVISNPRMTGPTMAGVGVFRLMRSLLLKCLRRQYILWLRRRLAGGGGGGAGQGA